MRITTALMFGAFAGLGASLIGKRSKNAAQQPPRVSQKAGNSEAVTYDCLDTAVHPSQIRTAPNEASYYPRADIILSAGPRKTQKETELGEDVAGIALTHNRIVFWILDGTSDSDSILNEQGGELLSSRLLALTLGATLHQLAPHHQTLDALLAAVINSATQQLQEHMSTQRARLEQFVATQHAEMPHWEVSTTVLLGILLANGTAELLRIGDSKALCFTEGFELIDNAIGHKPESRTLGRLHARLTPTPDDPDTPFTLKLIPPPAEEQIVIISAKDVRRVIAFSDGIGQPTEQYLKVMLGRQDYHHYQSGLGRTPNKTYDDKTLVLASFEPLK